MDNISIIRMAKEECPICHDGIEDCEFCNCTGKIRTVTIRREDFDLITDLIYKNRLIQQDKNIRTKEERK